MTADGDLADVLEAVAADRWLPPSGPAWLAYAGALVAPPSVDPVRGTARRLVVAAVLHEFRVLVARTGLTGDWRHDLPGGAGQSLGESVLLEVVLDEAPAVRSRLLADGAGALLADLYATGRPGTRYPLSPADAAAARSALAGDESDGLFRASHWVDEGLPLL